MLQRVNALFFIIPLTFLNFWWLSVTSSNIIFGISIIFLTFSLFITSFFSPFKKITITASVVTFVFLSFLLLRTQFDTILKTTNPTEQKIQSTRHLLYANGLGKIFTNKFSLNFYKNWSLSIEKYFRNISYAVDPNLYFFKSHPREKSGIDEFEKYSPILLPFFITGILYYLINLRKHFYLNIYLIFAIIITGFLSPYFKLGPILLFPFVNVVLTLGVMVIWKKFFSKNR